MALNAVASNFNGVAHYAGKRVLVTGCASGIGAATAGLLNASGAEVHGLDRIAPQMSLASFNRMDLAQPDSIDSAIRGVGGRIDALFNCAGLAPTQPPGSIWEVNFLGTRHLTDRVVDLMGANGAVASVSSNGGLNWRTQLKDLLELARTKSFQEGLTWLEAHPLIKANAYRFSKEAVIVWTMQQSALLIRRGIRINCTSPGVVQTPMIEELEGKISHSLIDVVTQPMGRRSTAIEQALPLLLLNSDAASCINGVDLAVDGGFAASVLMSAGAQ